MPDNSITPSEKEQLQLMALAEAEAGQSNVQEAPAQPDEPFSKKDPYYLASAIQGALTGVGSLVGNPEIGSVAGGAVNRGIDQLQNTSIDQALTPLLHPLTAHTSGQVGPMYDARADGGNILVDAGLGTLGGRAIPAVGKEMSSRLGMNLVNPGGILEVRKGAATEAIVDALRPTTKQLAAGNGKDIRTTINTLAERGHFGIADTPQTSRVKTKGDLTLVGSKLSDVADQLSGFEGSEIPLATIRTTANDIIDQATAGASPTTAKAMRAQADKRINDLVERVVGKDTLPTASKLSDKLATINEKLTEIPDGSLRSPGQQRAFDALTGQRDAIVSELDPLMEKVNNASVSFKDAHNLHTQLDSDAAKAFNSPLRGLNSVGKVNRLLADNVRALTEQKAIEVDPQDFGPLYQGLKDRYSTLKQYEPLIDKLATGRKSVVDSGKNIGIKRSLPFVDFGKPSLNKQFTSGARVLGTLNGPLQDPLQPGLQKLAGQTIVSATANRAARDYMGNHGEADNLEQAIYHSLLREKGALDESTPQ